MARKLTPTQRFVETARSLGVDIYTHREWGSRSRATYALRRRFKKHKLLPKIPADTLVQHITVTRDTGRTLRDFKADMRTVEGIGVQRFLSGFSYNLGFDMVTGQVGLGQPLDAKGTHTLNDKEIRGFSYDQNLVALAFSCIGMPGDKLSDEAVKSIAKCIAALMICDFLNVGYDYMPHSMFAAKDCPTEAVRSRMPEIYRMANRIYDTHQSHKKHRIS